MDATTISPAINAYSRTSPPCSFFSSSRARREITAIVILLLRTWPDRSPPQPLKRPMGQLALTGIGCKGGQHETGGGGHPSILERREGSRRGALFSATARRTFAARAAPP